MTECSAQLRLSFHPDLAVDLGFDAPEISSDGGVILLRQIDERLGLTAGFAACLPDDRDPTRVLHGRHEQSRQRIFQIALGYADCNDADSLRWDPLLTTACDRLPQDHVGLSSQPTLSRFENVPEGRTLRQLVRFLERSYVESLPADTEIVILDIDATDDETHGAQQFGVFLDQSTDLDSIGPAPFLLPRGIGRVRQAVSARFTWEAAARGAAVPGPRRAPRAAAAG